jgi:hypothetical protein
MGIIKEYLKKIIIIYKFIKKNGKLIQIKIVGLDN